MPAHYQFEHLPNFLCYFKHMSKLGYINIIISYESDLCHTCLPICRAYTMVQRKEMYVFSHPPTKALWQESLCIEIFVIRNSDARNMVCIHHSSFLYDYGICVTSVYHLYPYIRNHDPKREDSTCYDTPTYMSLQ